VAFVLLAGVWAMMSLALAIAFAVTLAVFGQSLAIVVAFAGVWAAVTFVLWRPWLRRAASPARR
jgi:Mn2+/Fe2+ NRAMP family transporter